MKFMFFTDLHIKAVTPARRVGSYEDDILKKLAFLLITAQKRGMDFIICGGDLFDMPNPSFRVASKVMRLIATSEVPWYHVFGNHELVGHNTESYDLGVLAFFEHLPNFHIMPSNGIGHETSPIKIYPVHYSHGVEENREVWKSKPNSIIAAHAMVTPGEVPFIHTTPEKLKDSISARLVLLGHYHDPWAKIIIREKVSDGMKKELSVGLKKILTSKEEWGLVFPWTEFGRINLFINPGSIARIALLSHNLSRIPRAIIVDDNADGVKISSLPISIAKPPDEVFAIGEAERDSDWENRIQDFLKAMENVKVEGIEAATLVMNAAKARAGVENIDEIEEDQKRVLDRALSAVSQAENGTAITE